MYYYVDYPALVLDVDGTEVVNGYEVTFWRGSLDGFIFKTVVQFATEQDMMIFFNHQNLLQAFKVESVEHETATLVIKQE